MPSVTFAGTVYEAEPTDTVLTALLRHGVSVPYSCKSGICGSCELVASAGSISEIATRSLPVGKRAAGHFLACQCAVVDDVVIGMVDDWERVRVLAREALSERVVRLRLTKPGWSFRPGQYLNLRSPQGTIRSYSIVSLAGEPYLEIHVARVVGGEVSGWLCGAVDIGDEIAVRGPGGACFYQEAAKDEDLLLVGTGTGLAPLWGIMQDAIAAGHRGRIALLHGGRSLANLYLVEEARELASRERGVDYRPVLKEGGLADCFVGELRAARREIMPNLSGFRVFLAGNPGMVQELRQDVFLAGVDFENIHADPFLAHRSDQG